LWVHDVDAVIASVTKHIPHPNRIPGSIDNAVSYALLFCWRKEVHMNGKEFKTWSKVRKEIRTILIGQHKVALAATPASAVTKSIMSALDDCVDERFIEQDALDESDNKMHQKIDELLDNNEALVFSLYEFLGLNTNGTSIAMHPYCHLVSAEYNKIVETSDLSSMSPAQLMHTIHTALTSTGSWDSWMDFASMVAACTGSTPADDEVNEYSRGVFESVAALGEFLALRTNYVLQIIAWAGCGSTRKTELDMAPALEHMETHKSTIVASDSHVSDDGWVQLWSNIISSCCNCKTPQSIVDAFSAISSTVKQRSMLKLDGVESPPVDVALASGEETKTKNDKKEELEKDDAKIVSLSHIRRSFLRSGMQQFHMEGILQEFTAQLQAFMFRITQKQQRCDDKSVTPPPQEFGSGIIKVNLTQTRIQPFIACTQWAGNGAVMHFVGKVTRVPNAGAIEVCTVLNTKFDVEGGPFASIKTDCFQAAWLVPIVKDNASMSLCEEIVPWEWAFHIGTRKHMIKTKVKLTCLVPPAD